MKKSESLGLPLTEKEKFFLKICEDKRSMYEWCEKQQNKMDLIELDEEDKK
jgi:hypothetical protein